MKLKIVILCLVLASPIYSAKTDIALGLDLSVIDASWSKSVFSQAQINFRINENLKLGFSLSYMHDLDSHYNLLKLIFDAQYYPFSKGIYIGLSVYGLAWVFDKNLPKDIFYSTQDLSIGYNYEFSNNIYIEAGLTIRDPLQLSMKNLQAIFPAYSKLRVSLILGYVFKDVHIGGENNEEVI